jgi:hypothetical protein
LFYQWNAETRAKKEERDQDDEDSEGNHGTPSVVMVDEVSGVAAEVRVATTS